MEKIAVRELSSDADAKRWDSFVFAHDEATFFHRVGWKTVIERSFGHKAYYLMAELAADDGSNSEQSATLVGILPLVHSNSLVFGNALVSLPFCVYGGTVADSSEAREALEQRACELADQLQVDYLELRNRQRQRPDWPYKSVHATFRKQIDGDDDVNLKAMKRKQRAVIRHSMKNGLEAEPQGALNSFFDIYSTSVRNLGTPVFPKKFFRQLKETFADDCEILTIREGDKDVSALMTFYHKDEVLPYYGGGLPEARELKSMDFMYWDLLCRAARRQLRIFDFGRSKKESGPYHYKRHWGFEPEDLFYEFYLVKAKTVPDLSPLNPKYQLFIRLWKKLPLRLSQWLGPFVSKYVG